MAQTPSSPQHQKVHLLTYRLPGGWQVLVGRTDADNDYLTFRVAGPDDWWFHSHGMPGSHVILQGPPGADPDRETLQRAAALAAYHPAINSGCICLHDTGSAAGSVLHVMRRRTGPVAGGDPAASDRTHSA
jgi:hypothetical protein